MSSVLELQAAELTKSAYGQNGGMLISDTTAHTGKWRTMVVLSDATFTTLTTEYTKNGVATLAVGSDWGTLPARTHISGKFTAVTLSSGSVLMIN